MILVLDHYDSFVENLARYIRELGQKTQVVRFDAVTKAEIEDMEPSHLILSPGPCSPLEATHTLEIIGHFAGKIPILGVCLGHQCIGQFYGMACRPSGMPVHGKASDIHHNNAPLFHHIPDGFKAGRYHSLILDSQFIPNMIDVTAWTKDGTIMGIQHRQLPVYGIQFHPESVLTEYGHKLLENFINATA